MAALALRRRDVTPPDLYSYKFKQDAKIVTAYDYRSWMEQIKKHAVDNDYPIPTVEEAENQLCRRLSGEWCAGGGNYSFVNTRFKLADFFRGTKVIASFVLTGEVVSQEIAEQRALICSRCPLNVRVPGCASCSGMANAVAEAKGAGKTKQDHLLQACAVCHCANAAQVWVPAKNLKQGVTPEMMETYKEVDETDGCWKYKELSLL
jgi:hypothetical protein